MSNRLRAPVVPFGPSKWPLRTKAARLSCELCHLALRELHRVTLIKRRMIKLVFASINKITTNQIQFVSVISSKNCYDWGWHIEMLEPNATRLMFSGTFKITNINQIEFRSVGSTFFLFDCGDPAQEDRITATDHKKVMGYKKDTTTNTLFKPTFNWQKWSCSRLLIRRKNLQCSSQLCTFNLGELFESEFFFWR